MQLQLVLLDRSTEIALDLLPRAGDLADFRSEEAITVAPSRFGRDSAKSAIFKSSSEPQPCSGASAMPMLVPMLISSPSIANGSPRNSRMRSASVQHAALIAFASLDNGEFIAAEPRQNISLAQ